MAEYQIPEEWKQSFLERNPGDEHRLQSAYSSEVAPRESDGSPRSGGFDTNWLDDAFRSRVDRQTSLMEEMWAESKRRSEEEAAREAERKGRADQLYTTLVQRSSQPLTLDPNDPIIRGQVDAFRNEQQRAQRNYISDLAEASGPLANLRGEERMVSERLGQSVGSFQAQLLARELQTRRAEIADALASTAGLLGADQEAILRRDLANIDNRLGQLQSSAGVLGTLGDLSLDRLKTELLNRQFYNQLQSQEDLARARLGFDYWDRGLDYDIRRRP